jgi:hypothetical protein
MTKEECKILLESQNWYKLFHKRITIYGSPSRLECVLKNRPKLDIISSAFAWWEAPEGDDYWRKISNEWRNLVRGAS